MTRFDSWESYFYPETYDPSIGVGVLRNKWGERDPDVLSQLEYGATFERQRELAVGEVSLTHTYDALHLRAIHKHLFQDVYEWAGTPRTVNMAKGDSGRIFADAHNGEIDDYLTAAKQAIAATRWAALDRPAFVRRAAEVFADVNQAHPFREGNGRASKLFLAHVAEQSPWALDFNRIGARVWNQQSELSRPDWADVKTRPEHMVPVFGAITIPRPQAESKPGPDARRRSLHSASYPHPPHEGPEQSTRGVITRKQEAHDHGYDSGGAERG